MLMVRLVALWEEAGNKHICLCQVMTRTMKKYTMHEVQMGDRRCFRDGNPEELSDKMTLSRDLNKGREFSMSVTRERLC
jgi:hypothetical protein